MMNTNGQSVCVCNFENRPGWSTIEKRQSMTISRLIRNASEVIKYIIVKGLWIIKRILQTQDQWTISEISSIDKIQWNHNIDLTSRFWY